MSNPTPVSNTQPSSFKDNRTPRANAAEPDISNSGSEQSLASEAADVARQTKEEVAEKALAAKERAVKRGREYAATSKDQAAGQIEVFGNAIRAAAETLEQEGQESVACCTEACADEVDRAARYVREKNFEQIYRDSSRAARRRPELFLGGMFVAGLALSRFLKASQSRIEDQQEGEEGFSQGNLQSGSSPTNSGPGAGAREGKDSDDASRPYATSSILRPR